MPPQCRRPRRRGAASCLEEQRALFDRVVEGDVGMRMRVEPMFGHSAFIAFAIVFFQHGHCVGFDIEGGEAEGAFAGKANQIPVNK